jgi:hypothetical protein
MARRGRPPRAETRAETRVEIRLTLDELRSLRALAVAHQCSVADVLRLGALSFADDAGVPAPIVLGADVLARFSSGRKSRAGGSSDPEE